MKPRIIFIHGNQASAGWRFAWAPWFKSELESSGFQTVFETMPDSILARSEYWLPFLKDWIKAGPHDVLVGWSTGAIAAMRYAETNRVAGSVLISPSYTDLGDEAEKASGYFDQPWEWQKIKSNQNQIALFYGADDPYIPQSEFEFIAGNLNPQVFKVPNGKHFIERQTFPELVGYILTTYLDA